MVHSMNALNNNHTHKHTSTVYRHGGVNRNIINNNIIISSRFQMAIIPIGWTVKSQAAIKIDFLR